MKLKLLRETLSLTPFALESEKESKIDERTLFRDYSRILDLAVNL